MSLLRRHPIVHTGFLTPRVIRSSTGIISNVNTFTVTAPSSVAPAEGNLMFILVAGIQNRTISVTTDTWVTNSYNPASGTGYYFNRTAGASENFSWNVNTGGSNLQGGWLYVEIADADNANPYGSAMINNNSGGIVSSHDFPAYSIVRPSLAIAHIVLSAQSDSWVITNGFTSFVNQTINHFVKSGYKRYPTPKTSEITGYTSSNGRSVFGGILPINGAAIAA